MVHWLDNEMRGRTAAFIADELAIRLEDYEWSLRKHGIATVTGTLEHLLDAKFLGAGSAVVAALGLTAGGATAAFVGGTFIAGKMIVEITHAAVELIDKRRQAVGPIAFVHELRKRAL
ncbi:MAG: hypothetical protein QOJ98_3125 [Acidobacteriota bacterium]|nr:hypothetical protein [Acidobacteriota bacterium]